MQDLEYAVFQLDINIIYFCYRKTPKMQFYPPIPN
jgi:hypothetical protein